MPTDLGETCIECHESVAWQSGRYVNRISAQDDEYTGYLCPDCLAETEADFEDPNTHALNEYDSDASAAVRQATKY